MTLQVGTFNIQHGAHYPTRLSTGVARIDLVAVADAIADMGLDICGLNEVRNQENVAGLCHQARVIAERLGFYYAFARAIDHKGGEYGNAIVSRYPILSCTSVPLIVPAEERIEGEKYEDRVVLSAVLSVDGRELSVLVTHFGLYDVEQALAADTVCRLAEQATTPLVLMGDFNVTPDSPYIARISRVLTDTAVLLDGDGRTFPSNEPKGKIDYIFANRGLRVLSARVPSVLCSDHRPFVCTLAFADA